MFLARARYERTPDAAGSRNGHRPRRVQTAEGEITVAVPQVRDSLTRFVSSVIPDTRGIIRTRPLEALVIGAYVRGLSDRDIESLAREAGLGSISRTAVSGDLPRAARPVPGLPRPEPRRGPAARAVPGRDLPAGPARGSQGGRPRRLGLHHRRRPGAARRLPRPARADRGLARSRPGPHPAGPARARCSWSPTGHRGSSGRWTSCGPTPIASGAPCIGSGTCWPSCPTVRGSTRGSGPPTGRRSTRRPPLTRPSMACGCSSASSPRTSRPRRRASPTISPALTVHLRYPLRLRKRLRSTNLLERSLEEVRRRTKVIGRFPGETSCLTMAWAVMDLVIAGAHGLGLDAARPARHRRPGRRSLRSPDRRGDRVSAKARDETSVFRHAGPGCVVCGTPLRRAGAGRRRLYCGGACRQRAYRLRDEADGSATRRATCATPRVERPIRSRSLASSMPSSASKGGGDSRPQQRPILSEPRSLSRQRFSSTVGTRPVEPLPCGATNERAQDRDEGIQRLLEEAKRRGKEEPGSITILVPSKRG